MRQEYTTEWPYLTEGIASIPMTIRTYPEDFYVEEIPAYEPSGKGNHLYLWIEKKGIATHEAVRQIAKALGVSKKQIGTAGLKDARAVTRQMLSVENVPTDFAAKLSVPKISVLNVSRHVNKLKTGHLRGNKFRIKLRDVQEERYEDACLLVARLSEKGIPNYFGSQRFGMRGDTWKIGRAILENDEKLAAGLIAGMPEEGDSGLILHARQAFDAGDYEESAKIWPRQFNHCITLSKALGANGGNFRKALYRLDRKIMRFYVSAFQSWIFNTILSKRLHEIDLVHKGDWAYKHVNGAVFLVQDEEGDRLRSKNFEISATGPLHGKKMRRPEGYPAQVEREVLAGLNIEEKDFTLHPLRCMGDRRPLRIKPLDAALSKESDEHGLYFQLEMTLPAGAYATVFLREIAKDKLSDAGVYARTETEPASHEEPEEASEEEPTEPDVS